MQARRSKICRVRMALSLAQAGQTLWTQGMTALALGCGNHLWIDPALTQESINYRIAASL